MRKQLSWVLAVMIVIVTATLAGCSGFGRKSAPAPAVPSSKAGSNAGDPSGQRVNLPGDQAGLTAALKQTASVQFQIVTAADVGGPTKDAYLDKLLADKKWPETNMLVLVVYPQDNYDIRFAMGGAFFEKRFTIDDMLGLVRSNYLPRARKEDPAGGLADLIRAINQRMNP
ncbi:MAG TPA: TPM domain-containing protein [Symbiobacteriaceae bacterium]